MRTLLVIPTVAQSPAASPSPFHGEGRGEVAPRMDDSALALMAYRRRHRYDVIFDSSEGVGIPLALLLKLGGKRRPGHVTIAHKLTTGKKRFFFTGLKAHRQIDRI